MAAIVRIEPTEAEMRAAWTRIRLPGWPATFEETMEDSVRATLIRMNALHPPGTRPAPVHKPAPTPAPALWQDRDLPPPPLFVDRKRAAAGERDDD